MFKVFYQSYCDYSQKTLSSINKFKLKSELIQCDNNENFINNEDSKHIPIHYTTYPKLLFKTDKKILFIGGNEEFQKFKEVVQPHVLAIQNEKAETIHGIKQLPEYAAFRKARSSIAYSYNAFMKKHDISARVMRYIYGRRLTWRWRGPIGQIKRKFTIRF